MVGGWGEKSLYCQFVSTFEIFLTHGHKMNTELDKTLFILFSYFAKTIKTV